VRSLFRLRVAHFHMSLRLSSASFSLSSTPTEHHGQVFFLLSSMRQLLFITFVIPLVYSLSSFLFFSFINTDISSVDNYLLLKTLCFLFSASFYSLPYFFYFLASFNATLLSRTNFYFLLLCFHICCLFFTYLVQFLVDISFFRIR
jgi:hypothetical protein